MPSTQPLSKKLNGKNAATHPDDLERHNAKWLACVGTGEPFEDEVRVRRADGQYRWHLQRGIPLRDQAGNIVKWYGVLTDIEDRKRAEEALRTSEAYLAEAQRLSQTGSWAWNPTSHNAYYSEECYRLLGFDPSEPPPRLEAVIQRIHPDDQTRCRQPNDDPEARMFASEIMPVSPVGRRIAAAIIAGACSLSRSGGAVFLRAAVFLERQVGDFFEARGWCFAL